MMDLILVLSRVASLIDGDTKEKVARGIKFFLKKVYVVCIKGLKSCIELPKYKSATQRMFQSIPAADIPNKKEVAFGYLFFI